MGEERSTDVMALWDDASAIPTPSEYVDRTFGAGGYLARKWGTSYQPREGQVALAHAVDRALTARTHLLSEAPTGTGKSLAYSVPATYHAATQGKVVVVVTANIALQEQIINKDLPLLAEILPWGFSYGLLKGRGNYLCRSQYERAFAGGRQQAMFDAESLASSPVDRDRARLVKWAKDQVEFAKFGDQSTLGWKPPDKLWRELSVAADDCKGKRCSFAGTCGALRAQGFARGSQVVVTNYHIFFTNLLIHLDRGIDAILPPHDAVIFDECHAAPDVAREFFGWTITEGSVKRAAGYFRGSAPDLVDRVVKAGGWFFNQMRGLRHDERRYKARVVAAMLNSDDRAAADKLTEQLVDLDRRLDQDIAGLSSVRADEQIAAAEIAKNRVGKLLGAVQSVLSGGGENEVVFVEEDEFRQARVVCRLVEPAQVLHGGLFGKTITREGKGPEAVSVVCTSATVTAGGDFAFARRELGVERAEELTVASPFDYEGQAILVIPDGLCAPSDPQFTSEVSAVFLRTIDLARGRTLGLFTSRKRMNEVYDAVTGRTPYRILRQDDGQRSTLIEEFRRDRHSVLLGVASFWAGVDVPGDSLSCVFIDKIPFPAPDDPILDRLTETDKRAWQAHAVPRAIIEFKQGFGRLIRSSTDRGVVVCCDTRLITKGYGKMFLKALPKEMQKVRNLEAIREWIDGPAVEEIDPLS